MERVNVCMPPLRTDSPGRLLRTHAQFQREGHARNDNKTSLTTRYDLSFCQRIDPGAVLLLMYAGRYARRYGGAAVASTTRQADSSGAFKAVQDHLHHHNLEREARASMPVAEGDYPLRKIVSKAELVPELEDWATCVTKAVTDLDAAAVALWTCHVSELVTNSFQHGETNLTTALEPILIAGSANARHGLVQLAVLDTGSGIPAVLRPKYANLANRPDCWVIRQACMPGVTSRCDPSNQGLGLPGLVRAVSESKGTLQILSGNGLCHLAGGRLYTRNLIPMPGRTTVLDGTLAVITVRGSNWTQ